MTNKSYILKPLSFILFCLFNTVLFGHHTKENEPICINEGASKSDFRSYVPSSSPASLISMELYAHTLGYGKAIVCLDLVYRDSNAAVPKSVHCLLHEKGTNDPGIELTLALDSSYTLRKQSSCYRKPKSHYKAAKYSYKIDKSNDPRPYSVSWGYHISNANLSNLMGNDLKIGLSIDLGDLYYAPESYTTSFTGKLSLFNCSSNSISDEWEIIDNQGDSIHLELAQPISYTSKFKNDEIPLSVLPNLKTPEIALQEYNYSGAVKPATQATDSTQFSEGYTMSNPVNSGQFQVSRSKLKIVGANTGSYLMYLNCKENDINNKKNSTHSIAYILTIF